MLPSLQKDLSPNGRIGHGKAGGKIGDSLEDGEFSTSHFPAGRKTLQFHSSGSRCDTVMFSLLTASEPQGRAADVIMLQVL